MLQDKLLNWCFVVSAAVNGLAVCAVGGQMLHAPSAPGELHPRIAALRPVKIGIYQAPAPRPATGAVKAGPGKSVSSHQNAPHPGAIGAGATTARTTSAPGQAQSAAVKDGAPNSTEKLGTASTPAGAPDTNAADGRADASEGQRRAGGHYAGAAGDHANSASPSSAPRSPRLAAGNRRGILPSGREGAGAQQKRDQNGDATTTRLALGAVSQDAQSNEKSDTGSISDAHGLTPPAAGATTNSPAKTAFPSSAQKPAVALRKLAQGAKASVDQSPTSRSSSPSNAARHGEATSKARIALNPKATPDAPAKREGDSAAADAQDDAGAAEPETVEAEKPAEAGASPVTNITPKIAKMWEVPPDQKFVLPDNLSLSMPADLAVVPGIKPLTTEQINELRKLLSQHNLQHMQGLTREQLKKLLEARKNAERPRSDQNATNPNTEVAAEPDELLRPKRPARPRVASTPDDKPTLPPGLTSPFKYKPWSPAWRERYALLVRTMAAESGTADTPPPGQQSPAAPDQTNANPGKPRLATLGTGQNPPQPAETTLHHTPNTGGDQNSDNAPTEPRGGANGGNTGKPSVPPNAERPGAVLGTGAAAPPPAGTTQGTSAPAGTPPAGAGAATNGASGQPKTGDGPSGNPGGAPATTRPTSSGTGLLGTGTAPPAGGANNVSTPGASKAGTTQTGSNLAAPAGAQGTGPNQPATNVLGAGQTATQPGTAPKGGTGATTPTAPGTGLLGTGATQPGQTGTAPKGGTGTTTPTTPGTGLLGTGAAQAGQTGTAPKAGAGVTTPTSPGTGLLGTGATPPGQTGTAPKAGAGVTTPTAPGTGLLGTGATPPGQTGTAPKAVSGATTPTAPGTGLLGTGTEGAAQPGTPAGTGLLDTGAGGTAQPGVPVGTGLLGTGAGTGTEPPGAPAGTGLLGTGLLGTGAGGAEQPGAPAGTGLLGTGAAPAGTGEAQPGGDFGAPDQADMGGEAFVDGEGIAGEDGESQDASNSATEEFTPAEGVNPNMPPHNHDLQKGIPGALVLPPLPPLGTERGTEQAPRTPKPLTRLAQAQAMHPRPQPAGAPPAPSAPPRAPMPDTAAEPVGEKPQAFAPRPAAARPMGAAAVIAPSFGSTSTRGTVILPLTKFPVTLGTVPGDVQPQPVAVAPAGALQPMAERTSKLKLSRQKPGREGRGTPAQTGDSGLPATAAAKPAFAVAERRDDLEAPEVAARRPVKNSQGIKEGGKNPLPPTPLPDSDSEIGDGSGLKGEYYLGRNFDQYQFTRADPNVDFVWATETNPSPNPRLPQGSDYSARWTGKVQPRYSETYTIYGVADDGVRVWVDHKLLIDAWAIHGVLEYQGKIDLQADHQYDIRVDYFEANAGGAAIGVYWESLSQQKEFIPEDRLFYPLAGDKALLELDEKPRTY